MPPAAARGDAIAHLVTRFNRLGLAAIVPGHGGGPPLTYTVAEPNRILAQARRTPDREGDGTVTKSLMTLRRAPDGLPNVSTGTIRAVLIDTGWSWQRSRSWCETGTVQHKRKHGSVTVVDPDAEAKKANRTRLHGRRAPGAGGTVEFVLWLFSHGIMPLYTPLGGSWLNMTESVQRILKRRTLAGHHPQTADEIITWLEATAHGWNQQPTPFVWGGKRALRRGRQRARHHGVGGSGACTRQPLLRRRPTGRRQQPLICCRQPGEQSALSNGYIRTT